MVKEITSKEDLAVLGEQCPSLRLCEHSPRGKTRLEFSQMNREGTQSHCDLGDDECDQWGMRNVQVWSKEQPVPFAYLTSRPLLASVPLPNHPVTVCDQTFTSFSAWKVFTYNWFCLVFSSTPLKYKLHESRDLDCLAHNYISGIKYPPVKTHHQWIAALPPPTQRPGNPLSWPTPSKRHCSNVSPPNHFLSKHMLISFMALIRI